MLLLGNIFSSLWPGALRAGTSNSSAQDDFENWTTDVPFRTHSRLLDSFKNFSVLLHLCCNALGLSSVTRVCQGTPQQLWGLAALTGGAAFAGPVTECWGFVCSCCCPRAMSPLPQANLECFVVSVVWQCWSHCSVLQQWLQRGSLEATDLSESKICFVPCTSAWSLEVTTIAFEGE